MDVIRAVEHISLVDAVAPVAIAVKSATPNPKAKDAHPAAFSGSSSIGSTRFAIQGAAIVLVEFDYTWKEADEVAREEADEV